MKTPLTHDFVHNTLGYIETRNDMRKMQEFAENLEIQVIDACFQLAVAKQALQQAYVHNQNMHCFQTKGRLNDQLNEQTHLLRKALGIPDQHPPKEEDPYQSEDYQRHVAKVAENCTADDAPCDSCLAGGICDGPSHEAEHLPHPDDTDDTDDEQSL